MFESRVVGVAAPRLSANTGYIKNKTHGSESILVTIYYVWLKCYLSLSKIVADRKIGEK
ncbi:MAG: hypothetical protein IJF83_00120 [Methanobrevibacter sp.]|nr:hypothetical protein [Methanobrevibacter sp.]